MGTKRVNKPPFFGRTTGQLTWVGLIARLHLCYPASQLASVVATDAGKSMVPTCFSVRRCSVEGLWLSMQRCFRLDITVGRTSLGLWCLPHSSHNGRESNIPPDFRTIFLFICFVVFTLHSRASLLIDVVILVILGLMATSLTLPKLSRTDSQHSIASSTSSKVFFVAKQLYKYTFYKRWKN